MFFSYENEEDTLLKAKGYLRNTPWLLTLVQSCFEVGILKPVATAYAWLLGPWKIAIATQPLVLFLKCSVWVASNLEEEWALDSSFLCSLGVGLAMGSTVFHSFLGDELPKQIHFYSFLRENSFVFIILKTPPVYNFRKFLFSSNKTQLA